MGSGKGKSRRAQANTGNVDSLISSIGESAKVVLGDDGPVPKDQREALRKGLDEALAQTRAGVAANADEIATKTDNAVWEALASLAGPLLGDLAEDVRLMSRFETETKLASLDTATDKGTYVFMPAEADHFKEATANCTGKELATAQRISKKLGQSPAVELSVAESKFFRDNFNLLLTPTECVDCLRIASRDDLDEHFDGEHVLTDAQVASCHRLTSYGRDLKSTDLSAFPDTIGVFIAKKDASFLLYQE